MTHADARASPDEASSRPKARFGWVTGHSRPVAAALILLVVAVVAAVGVALSGSSGNQLETVTAGALDMEDEMDDRAVLTADGMVAGQTLSGTVTLINHGDTDGIVTLEMSEPDDDPTGVDGAKLSDALVLVIYEQGRENDPIFAGALIGFDGQEMPGAFQRGVPRTFVVEVTLRPGRANDGGGLQDASMTAAFTWSMRSMDD